MNIAFPVLLSRKASWLENSTRLPVWFVPLVEILQPYNGRVYDPCCGSGGMFVQSAKFVENHGGTINTISIFGQDSNPTTWKMAHMNLAIGGLKPILENFMPIRFLTTDTRQLKADFIMANPPFNLSDWGADKLKDDVRWKYGLPPAGNANFAWMQHMIFHLAPRGRIGLVLANGSLSSQSSGEGEIRKKIIEDDLVDCIIAMPPQLFYTTQIPVSLWFLARDKKAERKDAVYGCPEYGHNGDAKVTRADGRGHSEAGENLCRLYRRLP